jgi:1-aminocyclopropane-1-carboxylate deaminase
MNKISEIPNENNSCIQLLEINDSVRNLFIKRDDLIHPIISGNKWRKLKYNILHIQQNNLKGIITFGGAYSNHLLAVALACKIYKLNAVGMVRGEELARDSNMILSTCHAMGMSLKFISRNDYEMKNESEFKQDLLSKYTEHWIVPEGGANYQGVIGCMEIMKETENNYDYVCVSQGTTTTSLGILLSMPSETKLLVCPALKGFDSKYEMRQFLTKMGFEGNFIREKLNQVIDLPTDECGKYGKVTNEVKRFIQKIQQRNSISFDLTYNSKSLFVLDQYLVSNKLQDSKVLYIHTGGFS